MWQILAVVLLAVATKADITGQNPPSGSCFCFYFDAVNVRDSPCGTVIGTANNGNCFTSQGGKQACVLGGVNYEFFQFNFGGRSAWSAGTYIEIGEGSRCSTNNEGYTCQIRDQGRRVHETGTPTIYDCVDGGCGNSCQGGQCVALVTCSCTRNGQWCPNTSCWRPGTRIVGADGRCNRAIPVNTAIATFSGSSYTYHAAIFVGCADDFTIRVYDQWCCRNIGYSNYGSGHSYYLSYYVITNPSCADRPSWSCRWENSGPTCCNVSEPGCKKHKYWWQPGMRESEAQPAEQFGQIAPEPASLG